MTNSIEGIQKNLFEIIFPEGCNFKSYKVVSFKIENVKLKSPYSKQIIIKFYQTQGWGDFSFIEESKNFNKLYNPSIIRKEFDKYGKATTYENFNDCKVVEIKFDNNDVFENKNKTCTLVFGYDNISSENVTK